MKSKKSNLPEKPEYKYDVASLAKDLKLEPASIRIKLRKAKVKKAEGGVYGWNSQSDYQSVLKKLRGDSAPATSAKKPAKKSKEKAAA